MPSPKYKHLSVSLLQLQVGKHCVMVGIWRTEFHTLDYNKISGWEYIIDTQRGGYMLVTSADTKTFCNERILQVSPDMEIGIRIRDVIEISADDQWVGARIQLLSDRICLVSPQAKGIFEFFRQRPRSLQNAVFRILDDFNIPEIFCLK
jgi:hypothetical protein